MRPAPYISRAACALAGASAAAFFGGAASLVASAFWATSVFLPLGIGCLVGGWLLFQSAMERIDRDNGMDGGR